MKQPLRETLVRTLGSPLSGVQRVTGGDLNEAFRLTLGDGRALFLKYSEHAHPDAFQREAEGLTWLAETKAFPVPDVIAIGTATANHASFLVLQYVDTGRPGPNWPDDFGRRLAKLHSSSAPTFGWHTAGYLGPLVQDNTPAERWSVFYCERRILPLVRYCRDRGVLSVTLAKRITALLHDAEHWAGPAEAPTRLHGDLWSGNVLTDTSGVPWLIDPAPYGGQREVDLAMMRLFGGFPERTYAAYEEAHPLSSGAAERVPFYQLYPLLVHLGLFGASYTSAIERALSKLGH